MTTTTHMDNDNMEYPQAYNYANGLMGQQPVICSNDRASYQSAAQIQAWADGAAGGLPDAQQTLDTQNGVTFPDDDSWTNVSSQMPGYLTHSNSSDGSDMWHSVPIQQGHGSVFNDGLHGTNHTRNFQPGDSTRLAVTQDFGYDLSANTSGDDFTMDCDYTLDRQPYPSPIEDDLTFSLPTTAQPCVLGDGPPAMEPCHGWSTSMDTQEMHPGLQENDYPNGWTTASADPSLSSQSSHHPGTPMSLPHDQWDETMLEMHPSAVNASQRMMPSVVPFTEAQSTVRPSQGSYRSPLPESWTQPQQDFGCQAYGSPISMFPTSRRSSEGEPLSARRDPLYQLRSREDGYWQCIFMDNGKKCDREPFKLKCNYDKHLDSHLKPYRCKQPGCAENPFSSTACLLRHEREAHGMHNHKEVLCRIRDCDRSFPGKGFPRKWNANDHMKRVHRYTPPEDSNSGDGASSPSNSSMEMPPYPVRSSAKSSSRRQAPASNHPSESPGPGPGSRKTKITTSSRTATRGVKAAAASSSFSQLRKTSQCHNLTLTERNPEVLTTGGMEWTQWNLYQNQTI